VSRDELTVGRPGAVVPDAKLQRIVSVGHLDVHVCAGRIEQITPLAGMAIQSTTGRMLAAFAGDQGMPIGPWQGLGVAFAWALGACGYLVLRARDA
jgi:hypothetical protein